MIQNDCNGNRDRKRVYLYHEKRRGKSAWKRKLVNKKQEAWGKVMRRRRKSRKKVQNYIKNKEVK